MIQSGSQVVIRYVHVEVRLRQRTDKYQRSLYVRLRCLANDDTFIILTHVPTWRCGLFTSHHCIPGGSDGSVIG